MSLQQKNNIKVVLEILASIATILALCIGVIALIPAFGQWLATKPITQVTPIASTTNETIINTPANINPSPTDLPTSTAIPMQPPEKVDTNYPGLSLTISDFVPSTSEPEYVSRVIFRPYTGSNRISRWLLAPFTKDISGNWQMVTSAGGYGKSIEHDDGTIEYYLLNDTVKYGYISVWDDHGIACWSFNPPSYPIIPVYENKTTEVDLIFSILEIGILDQNGRAMTDEIIEIGVESQGIDGSPIVAPCYPELNTSYSYSHTDERGIATLIVVGGEYVVHLYDATNWDSSSFIWFPKIGITAGETKRVIVNE